MDRHSVGVMGGLNEFLFCNRWPWCMCWLSPPSHTSLTCSESMLPPPAMLSMPSLSLFWLPSPLPAVPTLDPKFSIHGLQHLDWGVPQYVHVDIFDTDPSPAFSMLGRRDFMQNRWVLHSRPFQCILTFSDAFTAISVSFLMLCMSVYTLDTFVGFPKPFGPSVATASCALTSSSH